MKRFYKDVTVRPDFALLLDGKTVLTPAKRDFILPTRALADAVAEEWRAQGEEIIPTGMALTRLANTVLDGVSQARTGMIAAILRFGENDLLCYRAETESLARDQQQWDALLDWVSDRHNARLEVTKGLNHITQPQRALDALQGAVASLDDWQLAGLQVMASITSSLVLGLAVIEGRLTAQDAFALSRLDEAHQAEKWGLDAEAEARAEALLNEMKASAQMVALTR